MLNKLFKSVLSVLTSKQLKIQFHRDIVGNVRHGSLFVSHPGLNLVKDPIYFAYVDVDDIPPLTSSLFRYITDEAERNGYIVHCLRSYANIMQVAVQMKTNNESIKPPVQDRISPTKLFFTPRQSE